MKKSLFDIIREDLPTAIGGYYAPKDKKLDLSNGERKGLEKLLTPYKESQKITPLVEYALVALFRALKKEAGNLYRFYERNRSWRESDFPDKQIEELMRLFTERDLLKKPMGNDELKRVEFHFKSNKKVTLSGNYTDFLFEMIFNYLKNVSYMDCVQGSKVNLAVSGILYFNSKHKARIENKSKKRVYMKKYTYNEFQNEYTKSLCKELHAFFKKYTVLSPKGTILSKDELTLISGFLDLVKLDWGYDFNGLRNWIIR